VLHPVVLGLFYRSGILIHSRTWGQDAADKLLFERMLLTQIHSHSMVTTSFFSMFQYIYIYLFALSFTNMALHRFHVFSKICVAMCLWRWLPYTGYWPEPLRLELWARQTWLPRHPARSGKAEHIWNRKCWCTEHTEHTEHVTCQRHCRFIWYIFWPWQGLTDETEETLILLDPLQLRLFWLLDQGKNSSSSPCSRWHSALMHLIQSKVNGTASAWAATPWSFNLRWSSLIMLIFIV
jgi:hypothetical protein